MAGIESVPSIEGTSGRGVGGRKGTMTLSEFVWERENMARAVAKAIKGFRKSLKKTTRTKVKVVKVQKKQPAVCPEKLVLDHRENGRKLARSMLRRWRVRMLAEEIDSLVDLTLCEAAQRFSPTHGASFMTFFFYHLRGHLVRAVASAAQASNVFLSYSQYTGIDTGDFIPVPDEGLRTQAAETFASMERESDTPEQLLVRKQEHEVCRNVCTALDDLEKDVIFRSFAEEESLVDIAKTLGYSRCHISRVKKRALDRLRAEYSARGAIIPESIVDDEDNSTTDRSAALKRVRRRPTRTIGARALREILRKRA